MSKQSPWVSVLQDDTPVQQSVDSQPLSTSSEWYLCGLVQKAASDRVQQQIRPFSTMTRPNPVNTIYLYVDFNR